MSSHTRSYDRDAFEVEQQRDRTPLATALLRRVYEAQGEERDPKKYQALEVLEYSLGLHCRHQDDLTEEGVLSFEMRLERIVGLSK